MTQTSLKKGKKRSMSVKDNRPRMRSANLKKSASPKKKAKIENLCRGPQKVSIQNMSKDMTGFVNIIYFST